MITKGIRSISARYYLPGIGLLLLFILSYYQCSETPLPPPPTFAPVPGSATAVQAFIRSLIPEEFSGGCESLFKTPIAKFSLEYLKQEPLLNKLRVNWGDQVVEGAAGGEAAVGSADDEELTLLLHTMAFSVKHICVTMVTAGQPPGNHALALLTANQETIIHAFDEGKHPATRPVVDHLNHIYGNRLQIHPGNPTTSILDFHKTFTSFTCDLMLVNGDQTGDATWGVLDGYLRMSNPGSSIIVMDGYPTAQATAPWRRPGVGGAWELARHRRLVQEEFRCVFINTLHKQRERGFAIGVVTDKPKSSPW